MPLRLSNFDNPGQVQALNRWADQIENTLEHQKKSIVRVSTASVAAGIGGASSGGGSVALNMPLQFTVSGNPSSPSETLTVTWKPEPTLTFLQVPPASLGGLQGLTVAYSKGGANYSISTSASSNPATGFVITGGTITPGAPSGWTQVPNTQAWYYLVQNSIPTFSASGTEGGDSVSALAIYSGTPTIVQGKTAVGTSGATAFTSNNTSGNTIIVSMNVFTFTSQSGITPTISDSKGNLYTPILQYVKNTSGTNQLWLYVWVATNIAAGSNTVTWNFNDPNSHSGTFNAFEIGPTGVDANLPVFAPMFPNSAAPVNLGAIGAGGVTGILPVISGGTGTGNAAQGTAGGVVLSNSPTITTPSFSGGVTMLGKITQYNNVPTVGYGVPAELAQANLTAQSAAVGPTTIYTTGTAGNYRISYVAKVTTAGTTSTLGGATGFQVTYTDLDDSVVVTTPTWWGGDNNGAAPASAALNTTQTVVSGQIIVSAKATTNIQYSFGYASTGTAMQYNLHVRVEAM